VNGFDERFVGWGYEDEDLARRLRREGARILDAALESLMLHLFHPVHESHRPNARGGANYRYFKTGKLLTRPLRGLHARPVEELSLELLGAVPPALAGLQLRAGTGSEARPEVSFLFAGGHFSGPRPRGQVVVRLEPGERVESPESLYQLLRDRL